MRSKTLLIFSLIFVVLLYCIYQIRPILPPFIISFILSYLLNPFTSRLEICYKVPRNLAIISIILLFFLIFFSILFLLLPLFYKQIVDFIAVAPFYFQTVIKDFYPELVKFANNFGFNIENDVGQFVQNKEFTVKIADFLQSIVNNIFTSSVTVLNVISIIFIVPILVFYLLRDWNLMIKKINSHLPKNSSNEIKKIATEIDLTLSSYLRGQFNVCLILAFFYGISLVFVGLKFGFVIGFLTGFFSFMPYVGMIIGVTIAIVTGLFQWGFDIQNLLIIASIFTIGQVIEGNYLTPKLVGDKIGVHAVWIIFGLFAFGQLFGFVGILVAVPLTAIISTLVKHFLKKYREEIVKVGEN